MGVSVEKSGTYANLIQKADTAIHKKPPKLNDYGGDLSKRWYVEYYLINVRQRVWIAAKPLETRAARADRIFKDIKQGVYVQLDGHTAILAELEQVLHKSDLRDKTKQSYLTACRQFCDYLNKKNVVSLSKVKNSHGIEFYEELKERYTGRTLKNKMLHLKAVFNRTKLKPFEGISGKYTAIDSDFNYPYSDYEREIIENYLKETNFRLYLFTRFIFYAFIRPNELRQLRIKDIDLKTRTIKVRGTTAKNKRSEAIPIIKPLYDLIISERLIMHPSDCYLFGENLKTGYQMASTNFASNQHRKALKELNIYRRQETVLYSWKHTGNISFYLATKDIKLIQLMNRHRHITTTEIYLRKLGLFLHSTAFEISY